MTRLTDVERAERAMTEREFQRQVTDLAELLGWTWCHWRPLRTSRGIWQVPVEGPLGKGWPDLTLVRERDRQLIFAELKRELERPTAEQVLVGQVLSALPGVAVHLWRPRDLRDPIETSRIYAVLR